MTSTTLYAATTMLLLVMDPIGNIPVFISFLKSVDPKKRARIILRESIIALVILVAFLYAGHAILKGLQISTPALSISGGIILFIVALKMVFPSENLNDSNIVRGEPFIVPLAMPLLAGPTTMAVVMLLASRDPHRMTHWLLALLIAWFISTSILMLSGQVSRLLGEKGIMALERLMGMILITLSIQMFLTGVGKFFHLSQ